MARIATVHEVFESPPTSWYIAQMITRQHGVGKTLWFMLGKEERAAVCAQASEQGLQLRSLQETFWFEHKDERVGVTTFPTGSNRIFRQTTK
jgi:hypothetical protein